MEINKERAIEIIKAYEIDKKTDLFNWCEEYKDFVNDGVCLMVTPEVEYMLKKSYEDSESPLSYEDLDLFDIDKAREHLMYNYEDEEESFKEYANDPKTFNRKVKNKSDFEVFVNSLSVEELKEMFYDLSLDDSEAQTEVYEWYIIQDPLLYNLEKQGEIILSGSYWGRQASGQHISLDGSVMRAFINHIKIRFNLT